MSRNLIMLASLVLCSSLPLAAQSLSRHTSPEKMTLADAVDFVRPSIVQITARIDPSPAPAGQDGTPAIFARLGTGFIVNSGGYVITARHIVESPEEAPTEGTKHLFVRLASPIVDLPDGTKFRGAFGTTEAEIVDEDAQHDLALLKMRQNPFQGLMEKIAVGSRSVSYLHRVATLGSGRDRDGEEIAVSGYPLENVVLITTSGHLATAQAFDTEEVPGAPSLRMPDTADSYLADIHINPGNSGGPVYAVDSGKVIGVCVAYDPAPVVFGDRGHESVKVNNRPIDCNSGLAVVVPVRYVIDLLKKNKLAN